ncbi:fructosamine kinase family protein [Aestuariibaculum sediminum]|uniref:Fructosamine kinase family protein n=1 Tax=Aestuariibaculum sediminum TaxID=2770637 RepID=A0A8J6U7Q0_9FLAO|nr:fructosamine kinase family protein [Aestuariibaculum sediminum]MBD0832320.1 fructosamine kinase family protein [Aestuariibaculum sediminum]
MTPDFKTHISSVLKENIQFVNPVSGGDISSAYKISTSKNDYFLKVNASKNSFNMFKAEAESLNAIKRTNIIKTPEVLHCSNYNEGAFLILEFIDSKTPSTKDYKNFGHQLAQLHQVSNKKFGFHSGNFIGSLPQSNTPFESWTEFYANERLFPQLQIALQKGFLHPNECPSKATIKTKLDPYFQNIKPSLLHGDLWGGNYIVSKEGFTYLIDPALYYGHSEVDIAMSKLFSGFSSEFYNAYHSIIPSDAFTENRIEIYQLYYLLVHLNLFGKSYYTSVLNLLNKYF